MPETKLDERLCEPRTEHQAPPNRTVFKRQMGAMMPTAEACTGQDVAVEAESDDQADAGSNGVEVAIAKVTNHSRTGHQEPPNRTVSKRQVGVVALPAEALGGQDAAVKHDHTRHGVTIELIEEDFDIEDSNSQSPDATAQLSPGERLLGQAVLASSDEESEAEDRLPPLPYEVYPYEDRLAQERAAAQRIQQLRRNEQRKQLMASLFGED